MAQRLAAIDDPQPGDLYGWGIAAEVVQVNDLPDGALSVMLKSRARARVREYLQAEPFCHVRADLLAEEEDRSVEAQALIRRVTAEFQQIAAVNKLVPPNTLDEAMEAGEAGYLADALTPYLTIPVVTQQELLETLAPRQRLEKLTSLLIDAELLRAGLVEMLSGRRSISTAACRCAFLRVPRHCFIPSVPVAAAYADIAISTHTRGDPGHEVGISSISAPGIVAFNVGQLRLRPGLRVLEVGAGTGYNAAILAEVVGAENVTSIDLDPEIVAEARRLPADRYPASGPLDGPRGEGARLVPMALLAAGPRVTRKRTRCIAACQRRSRSCGAGCPCLRAASPWTRPRRSALARASTTAR